MIHRGFRYDLKPTPAQAERLGAWVGAVRFVYNLALEQRRDFWRQYRQQTGRHLTWVDQCREVTDLRKAADWIDDVPRNALDRAVRDLDQAFQAFFAGRARFPTPRARGRHDSFRLKAVDIQVKRLNAKWSAIRIPKVGWVKFRDTRKLRGETLNVTFALGAGRWTVSFAQEIEGGRAPCAAGSVGIDRGIAQTLTLSTGETFQAPNTSKLLKRRKRAQRSLARRKRGSARRAGQKARVARLSARMANIRTDWCHRTSTDIARRHGVVALEGLKIANMTASGQFKRGLNRSILEQCWGRFATFLDYKLTERGGVLISVPAAYTSQTCAACGTVDARSRESQAFFQCVHCGHTDNADVNAAKEILRRSTALLGGEGAHGAPVEPPIMAVA